MAYAAPTVTQVGPTEWLVIITGTNIQSSDLIAVPGLPIVGNVIRVACGSSGGAAATVNPIITRTTPPASAAVTDIVVVPVAPADLALTCDVKGTAPYVASVVASGRGTLYFAARPDAGADNTIEASFYVTGTGW